ncbi:ATP-dependent helicase [Clostridium sp. JN-9]|uniref:ATP-dependent helicase n=1 Tax=Clostridium sp. JN-9 TaxID=2507159 RepID=UPI000FFE1EE9|nr:ATP-dependent helicase [Clostridium sp. JN-9]QAT40310.1 ATP-dependent helicase [Clostridium sp. JN-9]
MNKNVSLDYFQTKAVTSKSRNLLVVAAPGSGKTSVIINRAVYLVKDKGVNINNILVITFTRNAAINMRNRYSAISGDVNTPFIGTFHSLFYKIFERHFGRIKIITNSEAYTVIKNTLNSFSDNITEERVNEFLNYISIYKIQGRKSLNESIDFEIFIKCYEDYENYKHENNLIDFDDLQTKVYKLLKESSLILKKYSTTFKYILVDEFQDCDEMQINILQLLNKNCSIFAVGDEDQCIYSFRGSMPQCMVEFEKYFEKGVKAYLGINYRSTSGIVTASMKLIKNNKLRNNKTVKSFNKDESDINIINCMDNKHQCLKILDKINILSSSHCNNKTAVLYRTSAENKLLIDLLIKNKIEFQLLGDNYNFYENMICRDLISYLKLSIDFTDVESFISIINKPYRYISKMNLQKLKNNKYKGDCFDFICNLDIANFQVKTLDKIKKLLKKCSKLDTQEAVNCILYKINYYEYIKEFCIKYKRELCDFDCIINEFLESCSVYNNIHDFIDYTLKVKEKIKSNNKSNVILSTIHGVKGMEFNSVLIMNCIDGYLPHERSIPNNIEEERRVFFVAVTRAIENLYLYIPKSLKGSERKVSRFINECELHISEESCNEFEINQTVVHNSFGKGIVRSIDKDTIKIEFSKGLIRQFDLNSLINNNLIKLSANNI